MPSPHAMEVCKLMPDGRILFWHYDSQEPFEPLILDPKSEAWKEADKSLDLPIYSASIEGGLWLDPSESSFMDMRNGLVSNDAFCFENPVLLPNGKQFFENRIDHSVTVSAGYGRGQDLFNNYPMNPCYVVKDRAHHWTYVRSPKSGDQKGAVFNFLVLKDGRIFICRDALGEAIYNPDKDTWLFLNDPTQAMGQTATLLPDGKILFIGGTRPHETTIWEEIEDRFSWVIPIRFYGSRPDTCHVVAACRIYDPEHDSWQSVQSLHVARAFHTTVLLPDGRVLVVGGYTAPNRDSTSATCEIINLKDLE